MAVADGRGGPLKALLPVVAWAALLFALSSIPGHRIPPVGFSLGDKLVHGLMYGVFGALCYRAWRLGLGVRPGRAVMLSALSALAYGISDEVHQMFVPQRSPEMFDVLADLVGGSAGAMLARLFSRLRGHA